MPPNSSVDIGLSEEARGRGDGETVRAYWEGKEYSVGIDY
jgi:hypothetical protein